MLNYKIYLNKSSNKYILLLHCICGDMTVFDKQVEYLKNEFNVLLIDLPYHGKSKEYNKELNFYNISKDIIHVLDENNISKITIIGLSLGGSISNYLLYYFNERVEKIIFASVANGLYNTAFNKLFKAFTKINFILPTKIYLKILIFFIIPRQYDKYFRKFFFINGSNIGKKNLRAWLSLLSNHFENYQKFLMWFCNSSKIPKTYIIGQKDYVFKNTILKKVINNEYNNVVILNQKSHMLNIKEDNIFSKYI